jgi:hypothetical protein
MAGFLGSGDLYYNRVVNGTSQGWFRFGNATLFSIQENAEIKERISRQSATYGQVLDSVSIKQPAEISVTLDDLNYENLALAFMGDSSSVSVTGASVTDEAAVAPAPGASFQTAQRKISAVTVTGPAGTPTYVADTDYEVENAELGLIKILAGGALSGAETLEVSYTYASMTANKVTGGTDSSIKVALMMDGINLADESKAMVNVLEAVMTPQNGVDFLSEEFATLELSGTLNTPPGQSAAYTVEVDIA